MLSPRYVVVGTHLDKGDLFMCFSPYDNKEHMFYATREEAERARNNLTTIHNKVASYLVYQEDEIDVDSIPRNF
jgi:hypothetical protein